MYLFIYQNTNNKILNQNQQNDKELKSKLDKHRQIG